MSNKQTNGNIGDQKQHSSEADELDELCRKLSDVRVKQQQLSDIPLQLCDLSTEQFIALKQQLLAPDTLKSALIQFRKLLAHDDIHPHLDRILVCGVLPIFVDALRHADDEVKFEAAWVLTNIAAGSSKQTQSVVQSGAVELLVELVRSSHHRGIQEQSVWCLGNITGDGVEMRSSVLNSGALEPLLALITEEMNGYLKSAPLPQSPQSATAFGVEAPQSPRKNRAYSLSTLRICMWALGNFCRGNGTSELDWNLIDIALPVLSQVICCCAPNTPNCDDEILQDACWALSRILRGIHENVNRVLVNMNVCQILGFLTTYEQPEVQVPALRCLINVVSGSDSQTQQVIDAGVLNNLVQLLSKPPNDTILKETCLILSNITAGTVSQVQAVIEIEEGVVVRQLIDIMTSYHDLRVRREACWALSNACLNRDYNQIQYMVQCGLIQAMLGMLQTAERNDAKITCKALESLRNILLCGDAHKVEDMLAIQQLGSLMNGMNLRRDSAYLSSNDLQVFSNKSKMVNPFMNSMQQDGVKKLVISCRRFSQCADMVDDLAQWLG